MYVFLSKVILNSCELHYERYANLYNRVLLFIMGSPWNGNTQNPQAGEEH